MPSSYYPTKDELVYTQKCYRTYSRFDDIFYFKDIRDGVEVFSSKPYEECQLKDRLPGYYHKISFRINPIKGKRPDKNNKIVCDGDVNILHIFDSCCKVVFGWRPRCLITLLVPLEGKSIGYDEDILEFNFNEDEIEEYLKEQQIEKYKEEIKAAELKKALKQVARQRLMEEGILFGEEYKRPYIPQEIVGFVYMRDGGRCCECGSTKNLQLDHIIPFAKGGSSEPENLQLLCKECNQKKGDRL